MITIGTIETKPQWDAMRRLAGVPTYTQLYLDPTDRTLWVTQEMANTGTPSMVWHGVVLTCRVQGHPTEEVMRRIIENNMDRFERVVSGHDVRWNGSNHVGHLTDAAAGEWEDFSQDMMDLWLQDRDHYTYWEMEDWLDEPVRFVVTSATTDEEIVALMQGWYAQAASLNYIISEDEEAAIAYATNYRDALREAEDYAADRYTN